MFLFALAMLMLILANQRSALEMAFIGMPAGLKPTRMVGDLYKKLSQVFFEGAEEITKALEKASGEIKGEVAKITTPLNQRLEQIEGQMKEGGSLDPALKGEVANLSTKFQELTKSQTDLATMLDGKLADMKALRNDGELPKGFNELLKAAFANKPKDGLSYEAQIKGIKDGKIGKQQLEINLKAVADMTTTTNTSGTLFLGVDQRPGITVQPLFDAHLRPLFRQSTTEKPFIRYLRETAAQGDPGMVAEATLKPQMDFSFDEVDSPVRKIAGYFRISEEMIDDIPFILNYLTTRGVERLRNVEDFQLLHGDGTGQNLSGLDKMAVAFSAGNTKTPAPNEFDVLVAAKKQLRLKQLLATLVVVHPDDFATMRLLKATTNEPLFPYLLDLGTITVDGTPIVQNTRVTPGTFYVMDARQIEVVDRMQTQVRLFDQDRDNAILNMVTCVIEERLAFMIYRSDCVIKSTFAAAKAALAPAA